MAAFVTTAPSGPDAEIAEAGSPVRVAVLHVRGDVVGARAAQDLLG